MPVSLIERRQLAVLHPVDCRQPIRLVRPEPEARVFHSQRVEDVLLQVFVEGHARDHFHQPRLDVRSHAVSPLRSRLVAQRDLRQPLHHLVQRQVHTEQVGLRILLIEFVVRQTVRETRRMPHNVVNGGRAFRRNGLVERSVGSPQHPQIGELR